MNTHLKSSRKSGMVPCNHSLEIKYENTNIIDKEEAIIMCVCVFYFYF